MLNNYKKIHNFHTDLAHCGSLWNLKELWLQDTDPSAHLLALHWVRPREVCLKLLKQVCNKK